LTTALVPANLTEQALSLDKLAQENQLVMLNGESGFVTALRMAYAIGTLTKALSEQVMGPLLALKNRSLGYRTDEATRKEGPYPMEIVRDCLIEAVLRGARPYGNEFNIIADRCYLTKEFYTRIVPELPGVTEVAPCIGLPRLVGEKGAVVDCTATWKLNGQKQSLRPSPGKDVREIAVRVNTGMGTDAILGKATRKLYKAIHDQITGWSTADGEIEVEEPGDAYEPRTTTKRAAKSSPLNDPPPTSEEKVAVKEADALKVAFDNLTWKWLRREGIDATSLDKVMPPSKRSTARNSFADWATLVLGKPMTPATVWTAEDVEKAQRALDAEAVKS
jgi:hypothetical protein